MPKKASNSVACRWVSLDGEVASPLKDCKETATALVKAGGPLTLADQRGETALDAAAACGLELLHHVLVGGGVDSSLALLYAVKHGDVAAATVS